MTKNFLHISFNVFSLNTIFILLLNQSCDTCDLKQALVQIWVLKIWKYLHLKVSLNLKLALSIKEKNATESILAWNRPWIRVYFF